MSLALAFKRGICLKCPRCGVGKLYKRYIAVNDACSFCSFDLKHHDAADGPAYVVMSLMAVKVTLLALWFEFVAAPPVWLHVLIWVPFTIFGSLLLLVFTKSLFISLQYHFKVGEFR